MGYCQVPLRDTVFGPGHQIYRVYSNRHWSIMNTFITLGNVRETPMRGHQLQQREANVTKDG